MPQIFYLAPTSQGYLPADERFLSTPLRLSREASSPKMQSEPTYGLYFDGIRRVLFRNGSKPLCRALERKLGREILPHQIQEIRICPEKHGSDYHPARIEVTADGGVVPFVMNVAVTDRGRERLHREFEVLKELNGRTGVPHLPVAYFEGETHCSVGSAELPEKDQPRAAMFLAEWFEGYHEFHLSVDKKDGRQRIVVWNTGQEESFLSELHATGVYVKVARILTAYYDLESFRQIFPWHHAAGDFVVRNSDDGPDVRLITARQYAPMVGGLSIFDALLFFLLNLSLRTRLDRLDGVGDVAWAEDSSVAATLVGFLEGLVPHVGNAEPFLAYAKQIDRQDLEERFTALVDACDVNAPDIPVIRENLTRHMALFYHELQRIRFSPLDEGVLR